jgi:ADP-ribose pyrophosphatase
MGSAWPVDPDVVIESTTTVWNGRFPLQLVRFRHRRFDGTMSEPRDWELWRRGRAAALLPFDPVSDQIVLVQQFRLPVFAAGLDPFTMEIPAGMLDGKEDADVAARRETLEEAGVAIKRMERIGEFVLSAGGNDETVTLFVGEMTAPAGASGVIAGPGGLADEGEDIRLHLWPADKAIAAALSGQVSNSVAALALLWLAARRDWLRAQWM